MVSLNKKFPGKTNRGSKTLDSIRLVNRVPGDLLTLMTLGLLAISHTAFANSAPLNAQGQVGKTSYTVMPFVSTIYEQSWGSSPYLAPAELFWNYGNWFTNPANMAPAMQAAHSLTSQSLVPASGSQRWDDTYEVAQPASLFPNEPANFVSDRNSGEESDPSFAAWVAWQKARPNLPIMLSDGGSTPAQHRPWGGSWGHISPLMPLAQADCPTDMTQGCTYGDWYAWKWGQTSALSGAYGVMLSDFSDSQPELNSTQVGFNPEIISAFEAAESVTVPSGNIASQATWITNNAINKWNDYLDIGYSKYYAAMAKRMTTATGNSSLIIDQCNLYPSSRRYYGVDERIMRDYLPSANYTCIWDTQSMQNGRGGQDPVWGASAPILASAREPDMRNGENMEALDSAYSSAVAEFYPTLSASDQVEKGAKLLKRSWLEASWAHVATRQGTVRRALAYMSRDYWDGGSLDPTLQNLVTNVYPAAPFGFALYYSITAERALEVIEAPTDPYQLSYYPQDEIMNFKNASMPLSYYVSDAALPKISGTSKPAAWIVLDHPQLIPAAEMLKLKEIAPILTSVAQVQAFTAAPLAYTGGLTGIGFYDQNNRLIITATNVSDNAAMGFIKLRGLENGTYTILDLFANTSATFSVVGGTASVPTPVTRWDTRAFAITRAGN